MNYSYLMGVEDVSELIKSGFIVEEIDGDYGITFTKNQEEQYEEFVKKNLECGYWNEYLGDRFVFIFKDLDGSCKRYVYDEDNEQEIFTLCCKFAECEFPSFMQMLSDNSFYYEKYFSKKGFSYDKN